MHNLTCIICPIGCSLEIENTDSQDNLFVKGNKCPRGVDYAIEEIRAPKRIVTATAFIITGEKTGSIRRIPVKTSVPCPREKISALLRDIYELKVALPVKTGAILISDWDGKGIDVVATRRID